MVGRLKDVVPFPSGSSRLFQGGGGVRFRWRPGYSNALVIAEKARKAMMQAPLAQLWRSHDEDRDYSSSRLLLCHGVVRECDPLFIVS